MVAAALNDRSAELSRLACALLELWASNPRQHRSLDPSIMPKARNSSIGSLLHLIARVPLVDAGVTSVCVAALETLRALHQDGRCDMKDLASLLDADQKTALELLPPESVDDPRREPIRILSRSSNLQVCLFTIIRTLSHYQRWHFSSTCNLSL